MRVVFTSNTEETVALGERLGTLVHPGDFIGMTGDLGSGKTHFVQGFARGLGVAPDTCISSPSYTLLNEYMGRIPLYHFDLYRLDGEVDMRDLGFEEYFYGKGVCVVEWADKLGSALPDEHLMVVLTQTGDTGRRIEFLTRGSRYEELVGSLFFTEKSV